MKSVRLNKAIRADMVKSIGEQYNKATPAPHSQEDLREEETRIALLLWNRFFGKYKPHFEALPDKFFQLRSNIKISLENGGMKCLNLWHKDGTTMKVVVAPNGAYDELPIGTISDDEYAQLTARLREMRKVVNDWATERKAVLEEAEILLESCSTTKQLYEIWPEGCDYLPPFAADPSLGTRLPALRVSRLNEFLGITEEQE